MSTALALRLAALAARRRLRCAVRHGELTRASHLRLMRSVARQHGITVTELQAAVVALSLDERATDGSRVQY